MLSST